jgi:hypothetical protein
MQGKGKKLKPIHYGPFKILKKVGNNSFQLYLPSYMQIDARASPTHQASQRGSGRQLDKQHKF